jgi:MFS family permease
MRYRQLALVLLCHALPLTIGMGLFPLLPLYAAQLGATRATVGLYFAIVYLASAAGVALSGWLSARLPRRAVFMGAGGVGVLAMALLGLATELWQAALLTATVWACGAVTLTLLNVFLGLTADGARRGRLFSLMSLAYPLGAVIGGLLVGPLVAAYGYAATFAALGAMWMLQPLAGFFALRDRRFAGPAPRARGSRRAETPALPLQSPLARADQFLPQRRFAGTSSFGRDYTLLLVSALLALLGTNASRLGTALSMQALDFSSGALASTATVSGLMAIPAVLAIGALSDRVGRRWCLALSYALAAAGAGTLVLATLLWHFWLAATLLLVAWCASRSIASALATDMLEAESLGRGLTRLNMIDSLSSIVGFACAGVAFDAFGVGLYVAAAGAILVAARLLVPRPPRWPSSARPSRTAELVGVAEPARWRRS